MNSSISSRRQALAATIFVALFFVPGVQANDAAASDPAKPAAAKTKTTLTPPAADPQQIAQWIRELDDDQYVVREAAQQRLADVAPDAATAAAVAAAADGPALESATRAVNLLLAWAESPDVELQTIALHSVADLKHRPVESAMAAERLALLREQKAVASIVALGGEFSSSVVGAVAIVGPFQQTNRVIIGKKWKGGAAGLDQLTEVRRLLVVSVYNEQLNDDAVKPLCRLKDLKRLECYGTAISDKGIAELKQQLGEQVVEARGPAFLGVQGALGGVGGARIDFVVPNAAAARAGIQPGDVIVKIRDKKIDDFPQLTKEISQCRAGESVPMKIERPLPGGGAPAKVDVTVTFERWADAAANANGINVLPGQPQVFQMQIPAQQPVVLPQKR